MDSTRLPGSFSWQLKLPGRWAVYSQTNPDYTRSAINGQTISTCCVHENVVREMGQQAWGMVLSSMQATPASEIECACGGQQHYQRMRTAQVISVFGGVSYERAYYAGWQCKRGKAER